jgi:DNA-binding GntR family transcriptional regulator
MISEGLLTNGPWNGAVVAKLDLQQLVELYTVREWLEGMAVALAARHASEPEIKNLHVINRRELSVSQEPEKLVVVNFEFHHALHCAAHNRYLLQSLSSVVDALGLLQDSTFILPGSGREAHKEHLEIIEAIERRDPDAGEQLVRQHVRHALEIRLQLLTREFRDTG